MREQSLGQKQLCWMNKLNHLEKERKDGRKQDRAAVPTEFQTSTKKNQKTGVLGGGVSAATDTITLFCKSNKKKDLVGKKWKGTGGEFPFCEKADQLCKSCKNIGTGSILARWDQSYGLDFSSVFSGRQLAPFHSNAAPFTSTITHSAPPPLRGCHAVT